MVVVCKVQENRSTYSTSVESWLQCPVEFGLCITAWAFHDAGWSSPVAREAHNLEVVRSNRTPATFCKSCRNWELSYLPTVGSAARKLKRSA